jgi:hypothetical protein
MSIEQSGLGRSDEEFSQMFDELLVDLDAQVTDPHLATIHGNAIECATYLNQHPEQADVAIGEFVQRLDESWEYDGQDIEVTGTIWVVEPGTSRHMGCIDVVNHTVRSRGFMIARKGVVDLLDGTSGPQFSAGHYVGLAPTDAWPEGANGVVFIEDIEHIALPYPSQAMRSKELQYYHSDKLEQIDRIIAQAGRPDQALKDIGCLSFEVDHSKAGEMELAGDMFRYLVENLPIEGSVTYRLKLRGGYFKVDDQGTVIPEPVAEPLQAVAFATGAVLLRHPRYFGVPEEGMQEYLPCLAMTVLEPDDAVADWSVVAPCDLIEWISSSRYDQAIGPTYHGNDAEPVS